MCRNCWGGGSATTSPEAQDGSQNINWIHAYQASYTAPLTSQILVEAGFGAVNPSYGNPRDGFDRSIVRTVDQAGPIAQPGVSIDVLGPGAIVHAALPRGALVRHRPAEPQGRLRDL